MRSALDFSSWQTLISTLLGLALVSVVAVGVRLLVMQTVQQRRERENRQINERLKTLIAAYKTLGGSFTGQLAVDPRHLRELRQLPADAPTASERARRVRDAVEAALSDVILLGTDDQVRLAAHAAQEMADGRPVETAALVTSLRQFIREVLELDPIPASLVIPKQGPLRSLGSRDKGGAGAGGSGGGGKSGADGGGSGGGMGAGVGGEHAAHGHPEEMGDDPEAH
jgi:type II secretory pathway pseudopilin PulG